MKNPSGSSSSRLRISRVARFVGAYLLHQAVSAVGVSALAAFATLSLFPGPHFRLILVGGPFYPIQISLGLAAGCTLFLWLNQRLMQYMWVLPSVILAICVIGSPASIADSVNLYFWTGCNISSGCYQQLGVTLPFYTSAAYSIGALIAKLLGERRGTGAATGTRAA